MPVPVNKEHFIKKAREKHGCKYNYSKVVYVNSKTPVSIICPIHGEFKQTPSNHYWFGCPKCANDATGNRCRKDLNYFLAKAKAVHGNKYDYSKVIYKGATTKVTICCPIHGDFTQTPSMHYTYGCVKCGHVRTAKAKTRTTAQFIRLAKEIHGNTYDYSKVEYVKSNRYVTIICKKHGPFKQIPQAHIVGRCGCPRCKHSKGEAKITDYLAKTGVHFRTQVKLEGCKDKKALRFDFGIYNSDGSIRCLIEYQGEQHYLPAQWYRVINQKVADKALKDIQRRDMIKYAYCSKHGIPLLYCTYKQNLDEFFCEAGDLLKA